VRVLAKLNHPHVIKYLGSFQEGTVLNIITELAESGSLYDMVKKCKSTGTTLTEKKIWKYFVQTALGLQHIHSHKILHRDVKTMNIFLSRNDEVKVGDLGVAKVLGNTMDMAHTMVGTPYYLSPELCEGKPYNDKSDVWSLGCVLYELCTLRHPFDASNQGALIIKIIRGKYPPLPSGYSTPLTQLLDLCLERDTRRRPDAQELLTLPDMREHAQALRLLTPAEKCQGEVGADGSGGVGGGGGNGGVGNRVCGGEGGSGSDAQGESKRVVKHGRAGEGRGVCGGAPHVIAPSTRCNQKVQHEWRCVREEVLLHQDRGGVRARGVGLIPSGPSARDGGAGRGPHVAGGGLANFLRPAGVPSRPPSAWARGGGGGCGGVIIAGGLLGGGGRISGPEKERGHLLVGGGESEEGQREYGRQRPGGPPRIFTGGGGGGGGRIRPATADPLRRRSGREGGGGEGFRMPGNRMRPGMPAVLEDKVREREAARLQHLRPPSPPAPAAPVRGVEMKPTTKDSPSFSHPLQQPGGGGWKGGGPVFFAPSGAMAGAGWSARGRPTIEDLLRQEVEDLPEHLDRHTASLDNTNLGVEGRVRKATEGHDDLLAWFRHQVVVVDQGRQDVCAKDDIWAGRRSPRRVRAAADEGEGAGKMVASSWANNKTDTDADINNSSGEDEGVLVWGEGGRGRQRTSPFAGEKGERVFMGRGSDGGGVGLERMEETGEERETEGGREGETQEERQRETEEERRHRLLAILSNRALLKKKMQGKELAAGARGRGEARDKDAEAHDDESLERKQRSAMLAESTCRWETEETLSGEEPQGEEGDDEEGWPSQPRANTSRSSSSSSSRADWRRIGLSHADEVTLMPSFLFMLHSFKSS
jgi:hypothetical protein